jgi:hypothetical protein
MTFVEVLKRFFRPRVKFLRIKLWGSKESSFPKRRV